MKRKTKTKISIHFYETPYDYGKRWGAEWEVKTFSGCPFGRYEKNRWCKTGIRIYYGSRKRHLTISWDYSLEWCPYRNGICDIF